MIATTSPELSTSDPSGVPSVDGPLSSSQLNLLDVANRNAARLRRAAGFASVSGWSLIIFGMLTLPFALSDFPSLLIGIALAALGRNELRGRQLLLSFDETAPRLLSQNQLTLMAVLIFYSAASIYTTLTDPNPYAADLTGMPEVEASLGSLSDLYTTVTVGVYGGMIIFSMIFQGLHAVYYSRLKNHLRQHVEQTPAWVLELQRMSQSRAAR